jgi:putative transposase
MWRQREARKVQFDAGRKVKGRKWSLVVDTLGLLLAVSVCAARLQDRDAGQDAWEQAAHKYPGVKTLFVDSAYAEQWARHIEQTYGTKVQGVRHPGNRNVGPWRTPQMALFSEPLPGFVPLPKRWVVERTHAWNERA